MHSLPIPAYLDDERIIDLTTFSAMVGLSIATTRRLIKAGHGPQLVRLSARRIGVRVGDARRWIEHRTGA
jgi:predicted DNA-binding transcriptional regulator AlpA